MTLDEEIAGILADHKPLDLGGGLALRPLSMDDFAANGPDLAQIAKALYAGIGLLPTGDAAAVDAEALLDKAMELLTPALPAVQRMLGRCLSRPLGEIPLALAPLLLRKFVERNFSSPHLKLWVGPLSDLAALVRSARNSTSAMPGKPSSTTAIPPMARGGSADTPAGSSSSGSGAASAASSADMPT